MRMLEAHHPTCSCGAASPLAAWARIEAPQPKAPEPIRRSSAVPTGPAEILITGRIHTLNPAQPLAEAIGVRDGRIIAVGSRAELEGVISASTTLVDAGDGTIYPGLIEPHMHYWGSALTLDWVDCSTRDGAGIDDIVAKLTAAEPVIEDWVLGQLFDPSLLPGEPDLTRAILDAAVPDRPVLVMNASMHFLYVNTVALTRAGIDDDTPDPVGGFYGRHDGHLTGVVGELAAMESLLAALPQPTTEYLVNNLVRINRNALAAGYTRTQDATTGGVLGAAEVGLFHQADFTGRVGYAILDTVADEILSNGLTPFAGDDLCRATAWKFVADGSNQGRTGYQRENYLGRDFRGSPNYDTASLTERMRRAHSLGWPIMVHANGDGEIDQALAAYRAVLDGSSGLQLRHRIEHCSFTHPEQLDQMAELGVSPSFLMNHIYFWGDAFVENIMGPDKTALLDPFASARARGLRVSMHSDYTVTDFLPFREIQTAVTRRTRGSGQVINAAERVSASEALRAKTIDAAWQTHSDDVAGTIEVGKFADLVHLDVDPLAVASDAIAQTSVLQTFVAGKEVYTR
ncbi:MAG TPA: amidohydrolase [Propionibacteriaceae bacterium]|nr:amidohydrolase [Propionibacteriaceae bacterium]